MTSQEKASANGGPLSRRELAAWRGFLRTHARVVAELDEELRLREGLSVTAYEVMILVADAPGGRLRVSEVADRTLLSISGTSRLVDRLAKDGLVAREPCEEDRRGAWVVLTPAGGRLLRRARAVHRAGVRRLFLDRLTEEDLDGLAAAWRSIGSGEPG